MTVVRLAITFSSLVALSTAGRAFTDHYTMPINAAQSQVQYEIETNLGMCNMGTTANGNVSGDLVLVLHPGTFPISDGQFDGGQCGCQPDLVGIIPNSLPGLPPVLQVNVHSLTVSPHSPPFQCDSAGLFLVDANCDVTNGTLEVSLSGGPPTSIPIVGMTSDSTRSHGQLTIDDNGIHLVREIGNSINVSVPALNLNLRIGIRGVIRANMGFPPPTRFCPATPNSTGLAARIDISGTPSVSRNDCQLVVTHCPPHVSGRFFLGDQQGQVPFGNGVRCATGQLLRLNVLLVDANGSGAQALDLHAPPVLGNVLAGTRWNFQFTYRDVAAGGALFNCSDALAVDFVP